MRYRERCKRAGKRGYSTVELLVAMALGLVVAAGVTVFNSHQLRSLRDQGGQVELQSSTRAVADLFTNEVRRAGMGGLSPAIESYSGDGRRGIRIHADLNGNGSDDGGDEDVVYAYGNGTLVRLSGGADGTPAVLLEDVEIGGEFKFYDSNAKLLGSLPFADDAVADSVDMDSVRRVALELEASSASDTTSYRRLAMIGTDTDVRDRFSLKPPGSTTVDEDFLSGFKVPGITTPTPSTCQADGASCAIDTECCSSQCDGGVCGSQAATSTPVPTATPSCGQSGAPCSSGPCCSGKCIGPKANRTCQ